MNTAITTTTNTLVNTEENEDTNNMNFVMNHKYFITGLVSITDMLSDKSEELVETDVNNRTRYEKLQTCCSKIVRQYRHNENILDEGKVIKKINNCYYRKIRIYLPLEMKIIKLLQLFRV